MGAQLRLPQAPSNEEEKQGTEAASALVMPPSLPIAIAR